MRRSALKDIGGLPLVDVGEDIMLSYLLHGAGWGVAFVKEEIQLGLAPETYAAYIKQRMRWVRVRNKHIPKKQRLTGRVDGRQYASLPRFLLLSSWVARRKIHVHRPKINGNPTHDFEARNYFLGAVAAPPTSWDLAPQVRRLRRASFPR